MVSLGTEFDTVNTDCKQKSESPPKIQRSVEESPGEPVIRCNFHVDDDDDCDRTTGRDSGSGSHRERSCRLPSVPIAGARTRSSEIRVKPMFVPPDQESMDVTLETKPKTRMPRLALLGPRRRRRQQQPSHHSVLRLGKGTSHPAQHRQGPSGSESTLRTEGTASTSSSSRWSSSTSWSAPHHSTRRAEAAAPPTDLLERPDDNCERRDDDNDDDDEAQESLQRTERESPALTSVRRRRWRKSSPSRRRRIKPQLGGSERRVENKYESTGQHYSLHNAIKDVRDAFHIVHERFQSTVEPYRSAIALDSNGASLHPALVGCVLGLCLILFWDLTALTLCLLVTFPILQQIGKWIGYFTGLRVHRDAVQAMKGMVLRLLRESEKAVKGDYSRQVVAGYLLHSCTAPGESYVASCIRYRMSCINQRVIQEMEERQLRRLGYQKSERDLFQ